MDFVVVGLGLGALGVLLGLALRDPGRRWCRGQAARGASAEAVERWLARGRLCGDAGSTLLLAGLALCAATLLALAADVADVAGLALIAGSGLLAGTAAVAWSVAARRQVGRRDRSRRPDSVAAETDEGEPLPLAVAIATGARLAGVDAEDAEGPESGEPTDPATIAESEPPPEPVSSQADRDPDLVVPPGDLNGNTPAAGVGEPIAADHAGDGDEPTPPLTEPAEAERPPAEVLSPLPNPS